MSNVVEAPAFDISSYLEQRNDPSFVMVEIGHGAYPLVGQQPGGFDGQRAYIGIEAGMRSRTLAQMRAEEFEEEHGGMNAFFLIHHLGTGAVLEEVESSDQRYEGEYDPQTILPDEAADEVVASNVFCDPLIARNFGHTSSLLGEMSRLVTNKGMVVLRETITPTEAVYVEYAARHHELEIVHKVTPRDSVDWEILELYYGTHKEWSPMSRSYPESYYLFLARAVADGNGSNDSA